MLAERVWGEKEGAFLLVIYSEGSNQPTFWECVVQPGGGSGEWEVCCGEAEVQVGLTTNGCCVGGCRWCHSRVWVSTPEGLCVTWLLKAVLCVLGSCPPPRVWCHFNSTQYHSPLL